MALNRRLQSADSRDTLIRRAEEITPLPAEPGKDVYTMNWIVNQHSYTAQRVFCIGRNYVEHIAELGNERPEQPVIFTKPATSLHPVSEPVIPLPRCGELPHYETEITVLVGKKGVPRTAEEAVSFIAGIGAGLDLTLRETQEKLLAHGLPWEICKGFDHSAPIGDFAPFSGTAETLAKLRFTGEINGELRQQGDSAKMIYSIPELLLAVARYWELLPGDVLFTGTPKGVGALAPGDRLRITDPAGRAFEWRLAER